MYYKESVINGKTYYKISPQGDWILLSNKVLTERCYELNQVIADLRKRISQGD